MNSFLPSLEEVRRRWQQHDEEVRRRREAKKARTKAKHEFVAMMNGLIRAEKKAARIAAREAAKKPPRVKLTDEELAARADARNKARTKTQMSREEYFAWGAAKRSVLDITKKAWFFKFNCGPKNYRHRPIDEPPKKYRNNKGMVFDTEFERDEYARGWREYREWCAENREAIKRAAAARRKTVRNPESPKKIAAREARAARAAKTKRERQRWKDFKKRKTGAGGKRLPWDFEETQLAAQGGCCFYCRTEVGDDYHIDHVIPVAQGGPHHPDNLVIACPTCNMRKSDLMPWEFKAAA